MDDRPSTSASAAAAAARASSPPGGASSPTDGQAPAPPSLFSSLAPQASRSTSPPGRHRHLLLSPRSRPLLARDAGSRGSSSSASTSSSSSGWDSDDDDDGASSSRLGGSRRTSTTTVGSDTSGGDSSEGEQDDKDALSRQSTAVRQGQAATRPAAPPSAADLSLPSGPGGVAGHQPAPPPRPASPRDALEDNGTPATTAWDDGDEAWEERALQAPPPPPPARSSLGDKSLLPLYCAPVPPPPTTPRRSSPSRPSPPPPSRASLLLASLRDALARPAPAPASFAHATLHESAVPALAPSSAARPPSPNPYAHHAHRHVPLPLSSSPLVTSSPSSSSPSSFAAAALSTPAKVLRSAALVLVPAVTYFTVSVACLWLAGDVFYYLGFALGFRSRAYSAAFWLIVALACVGFHYAGVRPLAIASSSPRPAHPTLTPSPLPPSLQFWMIVKIGRNLSALWGWDLTGYERPLGPVLRRLRFYSPTPDGGAPSSPGSPRSAGRRSEERQRLMEGVV